MALQLLWTLPSQRQSHGMHTLLARLACTAEAATQIQALKMLVECVCSAAANGTCEADSTAAVEICKSRESQAGRNSSSSGPATAVAVVLQLAATGNEDVRWACQLQGYCSQCIL